LSIGQRIDRFRKFFAFDLIMFRVDQKILVGVLKIQLLCIKNVGLCEAFSFQFLQTYEFAPGRYEQVSLQGLDGIQIVPGLP
jgi:hypothetical protein